MLRDHPCENISGLHSSDQHIVIHTVQFLASHHPPCNSYLLAYRLCRLFMVSGNHNRSDTRRSCSLNRHRDVSAGWVDHCLEPDKNKPGLIYHLTASSLTISKGHNPHGLACKIIYYLGNHPPFFCSKGDYTAISFLKIRTILQEVIRSTFGMDKNTFLCPN